MGLADLQAALQGDILSGTSASLGRLSVPAGHRPEDRLEVYKKSYEIRLVDILSKDFDTVWTFLGDAMFYQMAGLYVREVPSNTPNARWFSQRFPEFLAQQPVAQQCPAVPELAQIERAVNDAFDAPDAAALTLEDLTRLAPEDIAGATFDPHPSVSLLRMTTNAHDIFCALRQETDVPAPVTLAEPGWSLAWRLDLTSRYMALSPEEGMLLDLLGTGASFARLCEVSSVTDDPDSAAMRMAGYLQKWVSNGLLRRPQ